MNELRIVSLVPSLSELICELGLLDYIIACTSFCIEPKELSKRARIVGGTKDPDLELIENLHPSHIVLNEEENRLEDAIKLAKLGKVIKTFPRSAEDVPEMVLNIAHEFQKPAEGQKLSEKITAELSVLKEMKREKKRFAYFIWNRPWMLAGHDTYISKLLELGGFENVYQGKERYPQVELSELAESQVDMILFSSEPWPFRKRDGIQLKKEWPSHPDIYLIDGKLMSWFGSTTLKALIELKSYLQGAQNQLIKPLNI